VLVALLASARADAQVFEDVTTESGFFGLNSAWSSSWADLDGDGDLDVVTLGHVQPSSGSISQIWRNEGGLTFTDVTVAAGYVHANGDAHGVVAADLDNDGSQDFYVVKGSTKDKPEHEHDLMMNNGDGTFQNLAQGELLAIGHRGRGGYAVDYDVDGDLDLFMTSFHRGANDFGNMLFRNNGDGTWVDVAPAAGIALDDVKNRTASWADYDDDGDPDLLLMYPCSLFANEGNDVFVDVTAVAGIVSTEECSSSAWADYDRDGDLDVYVTSGLGGNDLPITSGFLYQNQGDGTFVDVTNVAGASNPAPGDARGVVWGDYDNDGWLDLYIVNGSNAIPNLLLRNNGDGTFDDVAAAAGAEGQVAQGAGVDATFVDYDNDGALDLFVTNGLANLVGEYLLLRNTGNANSWLKIDLVGTVSNRDGIMARVTVFSASGAQMRENNGPSHYMGQDSSPLHFGLGSDQGPVSVRIEWPDGMIQHLTDVAVNQLHTVVQSPDVDAPLFTNVTTAVGLDTNSTISFGNPVWGDINGDGQLDLVVPNHVPPNIYLNAGGTFTQIPLSTALGPEFFDEWLDLHGFSFTDINGDGVLDLHITVGARQGQPGFTKRDLLYQGNGDGTFVLVSTAAGVENPTGRGRSTCWFDHDADGDLDFFLKNVLTPNAFFVNSGGVFSDIAASVGLQDVGGSVCSLVDFDADGLLDIFLNSGGLADTLLRQGPGGSFADVSALANIAPNAKSRTSAWGDYDNDGDMDLFLARSAPAAYQNPTTQLALDNALYRNEGDGTFSDRTLEVGLAGSFNTKAASWGDVNNDGYLDLLVLNEGEIDGSGNRNFLYLNHGNGTFAEAAVQAGIDGEDGNPEHRHSTGSLGDYDDDGFLDAVIHGGTTVLTAGTQALYRNQGNSNHYLKVRLRGIGANSLAVGSVVRVTTSTGVQVRQHTGATNGGHHSQHAQPVHFGVGLADEASIEVVWPGGATVASQTVGNLAVDQTITLVEGRSIAQGLPPGPSTEPACSIWHTSFSGWHLRCAGEAMQRHEFVGRITTNGTLTSVQGFSIEPNDTLTWDSAQIDFDLIARQGLDRIDFSTTGDTVTLEVLQNGSAQPEFIRIGEFEVLPATLPITLTE
jgi:hypothetical protein